MCGGVGAKEGDSTSCEHNSWKRGGSVDASGSGANRVNDLYCLAFEVSEENRSKEAPAKNVNSRVSERQAVSTHGRFFLLSFFLKARNSTPRMSTHMHVYKHTEKENSEFAVPELVRIAAGCNFSSFASSSIKTPHSALFFIN